MLHVINSARVSQLVHMVPWTPRQDLSIEERFGDISDEDILEAIILHYKSPQPIEGNIMLMLSDGSRSLRPDRIVSLLSLLSLRSLPCDGSIEADTAATLVRHVVVDMFLLFYRYLVRSF